MHPGEAGHSAAFSQARCFLISICWKRKWALLLSFLGPPSPHRNVSENRGWGLQRVASGPLLPC